MNHTQSILRIGIIGCGNMGQHHIKNILLQPSINLVAICDPFPISNTVKSMLPEGTQVLTDPKILTHELDLDVVHIASPPNTHSELAIMALKGNNHIYVEKPFCQTLKSAEKIFSLANNLNLKICAGHQALSEKVTSEATSFISKIGRVLHIESYFSFRQARRNLSAADQLIDIIPHPVYLLIHFLFASSDLNLEKRIDVTSIETPRQGEVRATFSYSGITCYLTVTLNGRPVQPFIRIVGTNGSITADYIHGSVVKSIDSGASGISVVLNPYLYGLQLVTGTTLGLYHRISRKSVSYVGLFELISDFYTSIRENKPSPVSPDSITQTVNICEQIQDKIILFNEAAENEAKRRLEREQSSRFSGLSNSSVLLTGGTGFLGKKVSEALYENNIPVTVLTRNIPPFSQRVPGAQYVKCDLGEQIPIEYIKDAKVVIHCAAETAGDIEKHKRNTVKATQNVIESSAKAGINKFIHVSSLAVIKTGKEFGKPLDETTPLDKDNLSRGPYIWAKADAEDLAIQLCNKFNISLKVIRPGPLVDYNNFSPPGRLGREVGPWFFAIGPQKSFLSVCDVNTAAKVILHYVQFFSDTPPILNLVESNIPSRRELVMRFKATRPGWRIFWIPHFFIKALSPVFNALQKILVPNRKPINFADIFASENYNNQLAARVISGIQPKYRLNSK